MSNEEMQKIFEAHTLGVIFQVLRVAVNYCKRQKHFKILALHLKSISAISLIYDGTYPKSPGLLLWANQWASGSPV